MANQMLFFFSALGAFNGIMLAAYFAVNANKKLFSNYYLSFLLLAVSVRIIKSVFFYFNPELSNTFIQIGLSACALIGPFLYLYIKSQTTTEKLNWGIHIAPYLIGLLVLGITYPYVEFPAFWSKWIVKGIYLQWFVYIAVSIKHIIPITKKIKQKEKLTSSDIWILSIFFGTSLVWLAYCTAAYTSYIVGALSFTFIIYLIILLLILTKSKTSNFNEEKEKYKNKEIDSKTLEAINQKITLIKDKELFLNPNLTLDETAKELKVSKHQLSQFLNENLGQSFTNLINGYRIERAKELLQTQKNYTIEGIGYDSGFNSKSTFFTSFKKTTGKTPLEYQKQHSV
ncbi:MAG: helix-turn-helix domain-containing protein [Chitinophagaceae bacterium]